MSWGYKQSFTVGIVSGTSTSSTLDLGDRAFSCYSVLIQTMTTGAAVTVYGGATSSTTFYPVNERVNTAPVQHQALTIATSTSGNWTALPPIPFRYVQFVASATVIGGTTITVLAQD